MKKTSALCALLLTVTVLLTGCGDKSEIISTVKNESGTKAAYVFTKNLGTKDGVYQLSVLNSDETLDYNKPNAYISSSKISVSWASEDMLLVTTEPDAVETKKEANVNNVEIIYGQMFEE